MVLERDTSLEEHELEIVKELARSYTPIFALLQKSSWSGLNVPEFASSAQKIYSDRHSSCALCPARISTTVPAEIVPKDAKLMTAPFGGLIGKVLVEPGAEVKEGDVLAEMDSTALSADEDIAYHVEGDGSNILAGQSQILGVSRKNAAIWGSWKPTFRKNSL